MEDKSSRSFSTVVAVDNVVADSVDTVDVDGVLLEKDLLTPYAFSHWDSTKDYSYFCFRLCLY